MSLKKGSKSAHSLVKHIDELHKKTPDGSTSSTIGLSHVGLTESTVEVRQKARGCYENVLMDAPLNEDDRRTVILFHVPQTFRDDRCAKHVMAILEFLLMELFNTHGGIGFNQAPGGKLGGKGNFRPHEESEAIVLL